MRGRVPTLRTLLFTTKAMVGAILHRVKQYISQIDRNLSENKRLQPFIDLETGR